MSNIFDKIGSDVASETGDAQSDWQSRGGRGRDLVFEENAERAKLALAEKSRRATELTVAEIGPMPSWGEPFILWKKRYDAIMKGL